MSPIRGESEPKRNVADSLALSAFVAQCVPCPFADGLAFPLAVGPNYFALDT